jgi:hypothetical protein
MRERERDKKERRNRERERLTRARLEGQNSLCSVEFAHKGYTGITNMASVTLTTSTADSFLMTDNAEAVDSIERAR